MKSTVAQIVASPASAYSSLSLLGKTSRDHVSAALLEAGIDLAPEDSFSAEFQGTALCVREDAPCLSAKTLAALAKAGSKEQIAALYGSDGTPLAWAGPKVYAAGEAFSAPKEPQRLQGSSLRPEKTELPADSLQCQPEDPSELVLVQDGASFAAAYAVLKGRIAARHIGKGVILLEPDRTVIEADVEIGGGTLVYPNNTLQGHTVIGAGCTLYPGSRMQNTVIGDKTTVENSVLVDCAVGSHTTVGPFAYLRPQSKIGDHCRIGDFVEVKNSSIDDGTKVSHLTYVGDSDLGKDINLGCGVVFVNYDGKAKNRCKVEDHAFIGCNCNLVAPVHIGKNAYLAAGSTVTEDVPEDALYVARSRGVAKADWVKRRKEQGKL